MILYFIMKTTLMYILESCLRLCHEYLLLLLFFEREYRLFLIEVGMYLFLFTYGG